MRERKLYSVSIKCYILNIQDNIPIRARLIAVVDAYDAMTTDRPYRKKMSHEEAIKELLDNKGTQFDPKLVDIFMSIFSKKQ